MFKFLKDKLKSAVDKFSKDVEVAVDETVNEEVISEQEPESTTNLEENLTKETSVEEKPKKEISKPKSNKTPTPKKTTPSIKPVEKTEETAPLTPVEEEIIDEKSSEEEQEIDETEIIKEEPKKKGFFSIFGKKETAQTTKETVEDEVSEVKTKVTTVTKEPETSKGFFSKVTETVTKKKLSEDKFNDLFWEIELALLESNIAVEVIEKIKDDLKTALVDEKLSIFKTQNIISQTLNKSISELLDFDHLDLSEELAKKKPYIIAFIGVNGSGKTTNLAKLAHKLKTEGYEVVIAACDTFRAAAIHQIEDHANRIGVKLIKQDYGSDAAAVAFDAIEHAKAKGKDFVLIDTAGRNQTNKNLMEELKKLVRVAKPDLKIFVGDSLTGNDAVEQAKEFDDAVGIDGIILSKVDADEKGGASVSISYVTGKPIYFIGNGQNYEDLEEFNKQEFLDKMGL